MHKNLNALKTLSKAVDNVDLADSQMKQKRCVSHETETLARPHKRTCQRVTRSHGKFLSMFRERFVSRSRNKLFLEVDSPTTVTSAPVCVRPVVPVKKRRRPFSTPTPIPAPTTTPTPTAWWRETRGMIGQDVGTSLEQLHVWVSTTEEIRSQHQRQQDRQLNAVIARKQLNEDHNHQVVRKVHDTKWNCSA